MNLHFTLVYKLSCELTNLQVNCRKYSSACGLWAHTSMYTTESIEVWAHRPHQPQYQLSCEPTNTTSMFTGHLSCANTTLKVGTSMFIPNCQCDSRSFKTALLPPHYPNSGVLNCLYLLWLASMLKSVACSYTCLRKSFSYMAENWHFVMATFAILTKYSSTLFKNLWVNLAASLSQIASCYSIIM